MKFKIDNLQYCRWTREIFERERYWGHISHNDYAEGFQVGKLIDFSI